MFNIGERFSKRPIGISPRSRRLLSQILAAPPWQKSARREETQEFAISHCDNARRGGPSGEIRGGESWERNNEARPRTHPHARLRAHARERERKRETKRERRKVGTQSVSAKRRERKRKRQEREGGEKGCEQEG